MNPHIPFYRLPEAMATIPVFHDAVVTTLRFRDVLSCFRANLYLGGTWYTFDPHNDVPRIGQVLMARGRDAADAALTPTFGVNQLESFKL